MQIKEIIPATLAFLAMLAFYVIFYPGAMTWDSMEQLRQARLGEYGDWQPPAMAFIWRQLLMISDGPGGMLLFHMTMLYAASFFLYLWSLKQCYRWSSIFLTIPFLPWVVNFEFVIWKDVGLAYSWLLSVSIAIYYSDKEKFPLAALFMICFFFLYGFLVRSNSLAGAIFLLPFIASCIFKKKSLKFFLLFASCTIALFSFLPKVVNSVLSAEVTHPTSYIMIDDLAALKLRGLDVVTSLLSEKDMLNLETCEILQQRKVGAAFCLKDKFVNIRKNHYFKLKEEWYSAVSGNIKEYLSYRLGAFVTLSRSPVKEPYSYSEFRVASHPYNFDSERQSHSTTVGAERIVKYVKGTKDILPEVFKPYFWIVVSLLAAVVMKVFGKYFNAPFWMLPLSGFTYAIGYLPATPAGDFRYVYWLCLIATVSLMILVTVAFKKRSLKVERKACEAHQYKCKHNYRA